jgi:opacity protein-like surface antigen
MKRVWLMSVSMVLVMTCAGVHAQEKAPLGNGNFAVKVDYIAFTDDHWSDSGDDEGVYLGLEGYFEITPNFYLGGEVGAAVNLDIDPFGGLGAYATLRYGGVDEVEGTEDDINFLPVELNLKYAMEAASHFVVDFGAGLSYSYVELDRPIYFLLNENTVTSRTETRDEWLFGAQVFADVTYKIRWFSIGVNAKYQITEEFKDADFDLSNWRLGAQIGIIF